MGGYFLTLAAWTSEKESKPMTSAAWRVQRLAMCESTMDEALTLSRELGPLQFGLVVSEKQSRGRGRQGNRWLESGVGLYSTFILPRTAPLERYQGASLAVGVLIAQLLERLGVPVALKWPNDILSKEGKKLAGSLIELRECHLMWGLGINVLGAPPGAASLLSKATVDEAHKLRDGLIYELQQELPPFWRQYEDQGFAAYRSAWKKFAFGLGEQILLRPTPQERIEGIALDISEEGSLIVEDSRTRARTSVLSGHVERWGRYAHASCN